ncbi:MAG: hypothetical protein Q9220_004153 [cf. Caloplaca sp. 1 TL-2023]
MAAQSDGFLGDDEAGFSRSLLTARGAIHQRRVSKKELNLTKEEERFIKADAEMQITRRIERFVHDLNLPSCGLKLHLYLAANTVPSQSTIFATLPASIQAKLLGTLIKRMQERKLEEKKRRLLVGAMPPPSWSTYFPDGLPHDNHFRAEDNRDQVRGGRGKVVGGVRRGGRQVRSG